MRLHHDITPPAAQHLYLSQLAPSAQGLALGELRGATRRDAIPKASSCGYSDGTHKLTFASLAGVSVSSWQGTATPTVSGNELLLSTGTIYDLVLSNGWRLPFSEGSGATVHNLSGGNHATLVGSASVFWGQTQDAFHHNFTKGFTLSGAVRVPAMSATADALGGQLTHPAGAFYNLPETALDFGTGWPRLWKGEASTVGFLFRRKDNRLGPVVMGTGLVVGTTALQRALHFLGTTRAVAASKNGYVRYGTHANNVQAIVDNNLEAKEDAAVSNTRRTYLEFTGVTPGPAVLELFRGVQNNGSTQNRLQVERCAVTFSEGTLTANNAPAAVAGTAAVYLSHPLDWVHVPLTIPAGVTTLTLRITIAISPQVGVDRYFIKDRLSATPPKLYFQ